MIFFNTKQFSTNDEFFFYLYNNLGCYIEICYSYKKKDQLFFSKWISYEYLMHLDTQEKVLGTIDTKEQFIQKASHRSVIDIEIMLDIDSTPLGSQKPEDIELYAKQICSDFRRKGICFTAYKSGSKSIHISLLFPELRNFQLRGRELFKRKFIATYFSDLAKASRRNLIALEGAPHWKTGIKKEVFKFE